ncbi:MAG: hypothetical protein ABSG95_10820 [Solirubrobacteraceae bacterium]|jgi:surface antigen
MIARVDVASRAHSTPAILIEDGERWLLAPYGEVGWVRNARATGEVEISRAGRSETWRIEEAAPERAAPVLQAVPLRPTRAGRRLRARRRKRSHLEGWRDPYSGGLHSLAAMTNVIDRGRPALHEQV